MMTGKMVQHLLLYTLLAILGVVRRGKCAYIETTDGGTESDEEYDALLDDDKYSALFAGLQDLTALEIDLINDDKHYRLHTEPKVLYQIGNSEEELPECTHQYEVCSKVDLYSAPWIERLCRCPRGRACPSNVHKSDGYTIVDKTRRYKVCEPVKHLPYCRYFIDVTWTLAPGGGPANTTVQRVYCRCRKNSVPYLLKNLPYKSPYGNVGTMYAFACSPQSKIQCQLKEPCRLFTVRQRNDYSQVEEVNASPLCKCPATHRCPQHHTEPGVTTARSYTGTLEIKVFSGYCTPHQWNHMIYV